MKLRWWRRPHGVRLSVVVVVYDMAREAPRTLRSLSAACQTGVDPGSWEVVVIDNGSPQPLGASRVTALGENFRYHYIEDADPSPAGAVNLGVSMSRGELVGIMIDGARLASPGLLGWAQRALSLYRRAVVTCPSWHLGPKQQQLSVTEGYDKDEEDRLLDSIGWPGEGYRLFEIASLAATSARGCFLPAIESNSLFLHRALFDRLGGYDTAFDLPGGGLVNLDFFKRAGSAAGDQVVTLFGEGSFHQLHGGVSTSTPLLDNRRNVEVWKQQYQRIRGTPWVAPRYQPVYLGELPSQAMPYIARSAQRFLQDLG